MRVALFCLAASAAAAGPSVPLLVPVDPDFKTFGPMAAYLRTLRKSMFGTDQPAGQYVLVLPSFKKEWALQVTDDGSGGNVVLVRADDSLWYTLQERLERERKPEAELLPAIRIRVIQSANPLSSAAAASTFRAWAAMLRGAQTPTNPPRTIDGTGWLFGGTDGDGQRRAGIVSSPKPGYPTAVLVELVAALRAHAEAVPAGRSRTEAAVVKVSKEVLLKASPKAGSDSRQRYETDEVLPDWASQVIAGLGGRQP